MIRMLTLALGLSFAIGCSPVVYKPNRIQVPELQKKGDLRIGGSIGFDGKNLQGAYALTDQLGIMVNAFTFEERSQYDNYLLGGASSIEGGIGYYKAPGPFIVENYATLAFGSLYARNRNPFTEPYTIDRLDANFFRLALQSSATLRTNIFSISAMWRLSQMHYYNASGNYPVYPNIISEGLKTQNVHYFLEPGFQVSLGFKYFRCNAQWQYAMHLGKTWLPYEPYNYSLGMQICIGTMEK